MRRQLKRSFSFALVLSAACVGTETGNPPFEGELSYNTYASNSAQVALAALTVDGGDSEPEVRVSSAWLVLGDPSFVPADKCEQRGSSLPHATGLGAGDHATPAAAHTAYSLERGQYCGLELPLLTANAGELPAGAPEALEGRSIVLEGMLANGTPFRIESALQDRLFIAAADTSFELGPDQADLLVAFDVSAWLDGVDMAGASLNSEGTAVLSTSENAALLDAFEGNLAAGVALYRDPDGAGTVSSGSERIARAQ